MYKSSAFFGCQQVKFWEGHRWHFAGVLPIFSFVQQFFFPFEPFKWVAGQWHIVFDRVSTSHELSFYLCSCYFERTNNIKSNSNGCEVNLCLLVLGSNVLAGDEARYWFTRGVDFSQGFPIDPDFWREFTFNVEICDSTSVPCFDSGVWVFRVVSKVGLLSILSSWGFSTYVSGTCCQRTSGIGGSIVSTVCGLSIAELERRSEVCNWCFLSPAVSLCFCFFSADGFGACKFLGFLQRWIVGLGFSEFNLVAHWLTVFTCCSSRNSKPISSSSRSSCVTICSYVLSSKWAWFFEFLRCGCYSAWTNSSIMAWAAIPNAFLEFVDKNFLLLVR